MVDDVSYHQVHDHVVRIANLQQKSPSVWHSGGTEGQKPTFCSPNTSSRVSFSRANSLPWCISRCCSLLGFESSTSRIFCLSWPIVVDGGRPGKSRGALTLREGETMEMWTARSSGGGAADEEAAFSAMASKDMCW